MAARIRSTVNGASPIDEQSRNDLVVGDSVVVSAIDAATTYNWEISFVPEGSTATFTGSPTSVSPGNFVVDLEGPYLVKLTVDAGLGSEDVQYVRLRALTASLGLNLIAGGERRDGTGTIPVDIDIEGWANEQNANLQALEAAIQSVNSYIPYLVNLPELANSTVSYDGWVPVSATLQGVTVKMGTVNTQGTYTLNVVNEATGNSCLIAPFDMNTLSANTVVNVPLTGTSSDLSFLANEKWGLELTSDSASFNGLDIYIQLLFGV